MGCVCAWPWLVMPCLTPTLRTRYVLPGVASSMQGSVHWQRCSQRARAAAAWQVDHWWLDAALKCMLTAYLLNLVTCWRRRTANLRLAAPACSN